MPAIILALLQINTHLKVESENSIAEKYLNATQKQVLFRGFQLKLFTNLYAVWTLKFFSVEHFRITLIFKHDKIFC